MVNICAPTIAAARIWRYFSIRMIASRAPAYPHIVGHCITRSPLARTDFQRYRVLVFAHFALNLPFISPSHSRIAILRLFVRCSPADGELWRCDVCFSYMFRFITVRTTWATVFVCSRLGGDWLAISRWNLMLYTWECLSRGEEWYVCKKWSITS